MPNVQKKAVLGWFVLTVVAFLYGSPAWSEEKLPVQFAGVAFVSDYADINAEYPYSNSIMQDAVRNGKPVDQIVLHKLASIQNPHFNIITDHLANLDGHFTSVALAITIDGETISTEKIGKIYKLLIEVSAQLLFVDFQQPSIITAYPIVLEYIDVYPHPPTSSEKKDIVRALLLGSKNESLIDHAARLLQTIDVRPKSGLRLGIRKVSIQSEAEPYLPSRFSEHPRRLKVFIAQQFSKYLVENQHVAVLPYTKGQAIGGKMSARFSNGKVFNLRVPEPDFSFDLDLSGFKKVRFAQSAGGASWIYGSYVKVTFTEPLSSVTYIQSTFKNGEIKAVPVTQTEIDDWASFRASLLGLFNKLTMSFSDPTSNWVIQASNSSDITQQLRTAKGVIERCAN